MEPVNVRVARLALPIPLESLIFKALAGDQPETRHERLIFAWEVAVRITSCAAWATCVALEVASPELSERTRSMARPSFGHWVGLARATLDALAASEDPRAAWARSVHAALDRSYGSNEALKALAEGMRKSGATVQGRRVRDLLDGVVAYRNISQSTHASDDPETRRNNVPLLMEGLLAWCEATGIVSDARVVVIHRLERDEGGTGADAFTMHGAHPVLESGRIAREAWDSLDRGKPFLRVGEQFVPLFPWAAAEATAGAWRIGWFAGSARAPAATYESGMGGSFRVALDRVVHERMLGESIPPGPPETSGSAAPAAPQTRSVARPRGLLLGVAAVLLAGTAVTAVVVPSHCSERGPEPTTTETPRVVDASSAAPALRDAGRRQLRPGTVAIEGGARTIGSTIEQWQAARAQCIARLSERDCPEELFRREEPAREENVASFALDRTEQTVEAMSQWLAIRRTRIEPVPGALGLSLVRDEDGLPLVYARSGERDEADPPFLVAGERVVFGGGDTRPARWVTWHAADRFCRDHGGRLPSAIEHEAAARGTAARLHAWGDAPPACGMVVHDRARGGDCADLPDEPAPVGSITGDRSSDGVLGLGGNVAEWIDGETSGPCGDARGTVHVRDCRLYMGGDWESIGERTRAAARNRSAADAAWPTVGLRCAYELR